MSQFVWRALSDAGLPCHVHYAGELAAALLGEDMLLITPQHEYADYLRGEYFGHEIVTAVYLDEENREELLGAIAWQPVECPRLVKSA